MVPRVSAQHSSYTPESLFVALLADGNALVEYDISVPDPMSREIRINLFGQDISNLIVVDYEDSMIKFKEGNSPNEIVLDTPGASNIRISYTTPDFLSKDKRDWIFALNSSIDVSVKLPPDSILTDQGQNQPSIRIVGNQSLLTFKPGNIRFVYVIGTLGTQEQANISIKAAQTTIDELTKKYSDIILTEARQLLQNATLARDAGRFADADKLADHANDAAIATGRDYEAAQKAITDAQAQIDGNMSQGRDTVYSKQLLQQANIGFTNGNYAEATNSANGAITAIGNKPAVPTLSMPVIIATVAVVGVGVGVLVFLRKYKPSRGKLLQQHHPQHQRLDQNNNNDSLPADPNNKPPVSPTPVEEIKTKDEQGKYDGNVQQPLLQDDPPTAPSAAISDSQTDRSVLSRIVGGIIEDRPHLRLEDQQVLRFLAEKEGAAFESEIRGNFKLPKTTIWRLVKRLEREELIEIRKAGGQNLIKLKFEDKRI